MDSYKLETVACENSLVFTRFQIGYSMFVNKLIFECPCGTPNHKLLPVCLYATKFKERWNIENFDLYSSNPFLICANKMSGGSKIVNNKNTAVTDGQDLIKVMTNLNNKSTSYMCPTSKLKIKNVVVIDNDTYESTTPTNYCAVLFNPPYTFKFIDKLMECQVLCLHKECTYDELTLHVHRKGNCIDMRDLRQNINMDFVKLCNGNKTCIFCS